MPRILAWFTNLYPLWVAAVAALALMQPGLMLWFNPYVVVALGFVMLNMGLTLTLADFKGLARMPGCVAVGFTLHYTIMPLSGWLVAHWLKLDPPLAVGVILVASCPCGVASNLMTYLARGNLALSVCLTMTSTLLAFIMTPLWCRALAGHYVPVRALDMSISTLKLVVVPVLAGVLINSRLPRAVSRVVPYSQVMAVLAFLFVTGGIVSKDAETIRSSAGLLTLAAVLLHTLGFGLGYGATRLLGYPLNIARTLSIEVGMQNAGLAAALARANISSMSLAAVPAVFSALIENFIGSALATWWRLHPVEVEESGRKDS